jgi:hypothetical protein
MGEIHISNSSEGDYYEGKIYDILKPTIRDGTQHTKVIGSVMYRDKNQKSIEGFVVAPVTVCSVPPAPGQQEMENSDCKNPVMYCFECTESIGKT